mmetsp:Transcript_37829/g.93898  ORF Transcript_37829/g.93898 Transcript_37829/m.93898 type:complete len:159 (-) Transcript_37829:91-567(-)
MCRRLEERELCDEMLLGTMVGFALQVLSGLALNLSSLGEGKRMFGHSSNVLLIMLTDGLALSFAISLSAIAAELASPAEVTIIYQLEGPFGATISILILGERLSMLTGVGGGVIFLVVGSLELYLYLETRKALPQFEQLPAKMVAVLRKHVTASPGSV